jgi:hypothetical protein
MCAQRMLRAFTSYEIVKSAPAPRDDDRQLALNLGPPKSATFDKVGRLASRFAQHLKEVKGIAGTHEADEFDARSVNASIGMVAELADSLIDALISDAEARGLNASGAWMHIPLIEVREFQASASDPGPKEADDIHDRKMNS